MALILQKMQHGVWKMKIAVKVSTLENTHIEEKECLFKQNGADACYKQLTDQIQRLANGVLNF